MYLCARRPATASVSSICMLTCEFSLSGINRAFSLGSSDGREQVKMKDAKFWNAQVTITDV